MFVSLAIQSDICCFGSLCLRGVFDITVPDNCTGCAVTMRQCCHWKRSEGLCGSRTDSGFVGKQSGRAQGAHILGMGHVVNEHTWFMLFATALPQSLRSPNDSWCYPDRGAIRGREGWGNAEQAKFGMAKFGTPNYAAVFEGQSPFF